ncbi:MAG: hypothetical protein IPK82_06885 [Polyangiaceae bacterium]|nr:hypothetical protein [Polyangiaceae bacterium]
MSDERDAEDIGHEAPEKERRAEVPPRIAARERLLAILVGASLVGSVSLIGSVYTLPFLFVAALAVAAAITAVPLREISAKDRAWPTPALILLGLALFSVL